VNLIAGLALTLVSVVAMWQGAGPVGLAATYLTGPVISLALLAAIVRRQGYRVRVRGSLRRYAELLRESRSIASQQFLANLEERATQLLVPKLVGVNAFGHFAAGTIPATRLNVVPDALATAFYPAVANGGREDPRGAERQVSLLVIVSLVACLPTAALVAFLARPIAGILFPNEAETCRKIIQLTIWSLPLTALTMSMLFSLQATGKDRAVARSGGAAAVCSLICSVTLVSTAGIPGACWAWVLRPAILAAFLLPSFLRTFRGVPAQVPVARILCALAAMVASLALFASVQMPRWLDIAAGCGAGLAAYAASLAVLRVVTAGDVRRILSRSAPGVPK
jgi:O-antigen/teichoic acid export membrane protein